MRCARVALFPSSLSAASAGVRTLPVCVAALVVSCLALLPSAASASPAPFGAVTEFSAGSFPDGIAAGPDGNLWFTEARRIGRITPTGVVTEFSAGITPESFLGGSITAGPDGNLWFTELSGIFGEPDRIGRITPTGVVTEFSAGITPESFLGGSIAAGPDGNLWFTVQQPSQIGRITPTGEVTEFSEGITEGSRPDGITAGPDGNLWFTESESSPFGNRIGRITPTGEVTEFSAGISPESRPEAITAGPDGNLWFTETNGNRIGRITPAGVVTEFSEGITPGSEPQGIAAGPDGNVWFTERQDAIGRITPTGVVTEFSAGITPGGLPFGITAGPDGNVWFTEPFGNRIGRIGTGVAQHGHRPLGGTTTSTSSFHFLSASKGTSDGIGRLSHLGKVTFHKDYTAFSFTSSHSFTDAGTETIVTANGDKLFADFSAKGTFTGAEVGSTAQVTDSATITGGTGRFAGCFCGRYTETTSSVLTSVVFGVEATTNDTSTYAGEIAY